MNDVAELKRFVEVHARAQGLTPARYRPILDRVRTDGDGTPGSWVHEWTHAAESLERRGDWLGACRYYNLARFPYATSPARQEALHRCVAAFDRWRRDRSGIDQLTLDLPGGRVNCWTSGLSTTAPKPLLLVLGGIVSIKEQWAPVLRQARRLGMAGIVTEMPGVGENTLQYGPDSWRMLPAILDAVTGRADVSRTYAVALSFSGHMALRWASDDPRVRGIATAGAPIESFFTDRAWQSALPRITVDTLAHLTGLPAATLLERLPTWSLDASRLAALNIPVCYLASGRDEIIPPDEVRNLRERLPRLDLVENDDVHGSPAHVLESRLWVALSLLRMRDVRDARRVAIAALWRLARARHRPRPTTA